MPELEKSAGKLSKDKVAVLALWFVVLVGIRVLLGFVLHNMWIGTIGAVGITFVIFYASLRYTKLQKYRQLINATLTSWYRKKFFYISGIVSMFILGGLLAFIEYGHAYYSDRLITIKINEQEIGKSFEALAANSQLQSTLVENLQRYSAVDVIAIILASADKTLGGHYVQAVSYMFAEDIEIMVFTLLFRTRKEIFAAPHAEEQQESLVEKVTAIVEDEESDVQAAIEKQQIVAGQLEAAGLELPEITMNERLRNGDNDKVSNN